jgi:hypothetical protein
MKLRKGEFGHYMFVPTVTVSFSVMVIIAWDMSIITTTSSWWWLGLLRNRLLLVLWSGVNGHCFTVIISHLI